ncbi:marker for oxidative stress response protein [Thalictrum thalictroides]|uniref:Marker for oxidative stress response protein n=1 Tax=Thalictrum thalictroides TaxID=46969 RepID=A0A7J6V967_THATH|nr:marker for oxidative stress response protein [Thalictrum thalictroides]
MSTQQSEPESQSSSVATATPPPMTSCRKKKSDDATFLEDLKDHIDEFVHASMDEHKNCFKKTMQKMFGMSKVVAEKNAGAKEVESMLPFKTVVAD